MDLDLEACFEAADDALDDCETMELASVLEARRSAARRRLTGAGGVEGQSGVRVLMYRGSVKGRKANKHRDFAIGVFNIKRDFFGVDDQYDFERRFRVPRSVFCAFTTRSRTNRGLSSPATLLGRRRLIPCRR